MPFTPEHPATATAPARRTRRTAHPLHWLRAFLTQRLRLQRQGLQIHLMLDPAPPAAAPVAVAAPSPHRGEALRRDHLALCALLDRHADARYTMRHLAYLEQALARSGSRAIKETPTRVLAEALAQLESLLHEHSAEGFAELRSRVREAVARREQAPRPHAAPELADVSEATHSLFEEMERSWVGEPPAAASARQPA